MTIETTDLRDKRILVTGCATRIGRATIALLAEQGALCGNCHFEGPCDGV